MNKINWSAVAAFGVVVLLAFLIGVSLLGGGYGGWGMMGPGMMGGWGFGSFGWIGMLFMWLIPVGFIVLTVLGVVGLVRAVGPHPNPPPPAGEGAARACPSCGRGVQADWRNCPHCGAALA
ncbi:MAG: zinc ribbon domain-containing protein [Armatimonadetes bacterium]|nr:zinc ribbon domain-containing protein [Armatimonadota bacterium]